MGFLKRALAVMLRRGGPVVEPSASTVTAPTAGRPLPPAVAPRWEWRGEHGPELTDIRAGKRIVRTDAEVAAGFARVAYLPPRPTVPPAAPPPPGGEGGSRCRCAR